MSTDERDKEMPSGGLTITGFRRKYDLANGTFYEARKRGETPDELRIGKKVLITPQAEAEWLKRQTRPAGGVREAAARAQAESEVREVVVRATDVAPAAPKSERTRRASKPRAARPAAKRTGKRAAVRDAETV